MTTLGGIIGITAGISSDGLVGTAVGLRVGGRVGVGDTSGPGPLVASNDITEPLKLM